MRSPRRRARSSSKKTPSTAPTRRTDTVAFIVSSRGRPKELASCLASLVLQDDPKTLIVCTTKDNPKSIDGVRKVCRQFGAKLMDTRSETMYHATLEAIENSESEWLCFPNDDSYLMPLYSRIMIREANRAGWDLVYTDVVYDPRMDKNYYKVFEVSPVAGRIDKICAMVRRSAFKGFPMIDHPQFWTMADGLFIRQMVKDGVAHGKVP